jgi:hypothetical protein
VKKKRCVPTKKNNLMDASKILPSVSPIYRVDLFYSWHGVGDILSEVKKKIGRLKRVKV